jgi:hypothetical protein
MNLYLTVHIKDLTDLMQASHSGPTKSGRASKNLHAHNERYSMTNSMQVHGYTALRVRPIYARMHVHYAIYAAQV